MSVTKNEGHFLWVESYRPKFIKECILPNRIKGYFNDILKDGNLPHLMLSGGPGVGKTTSAKALCNELNLDYLMINASENGNIDTLRTTIRSFASTVSFTSPYKVVILDECLEENEEVRVGTVDNWVPMKLNEMNPDVDYPIVSFNMDSGEYENDTGRIISDKEDDIYEVTLEDGRTVLVNEKHPFIVRTENGFEECNIASGLLIGSDVVA